MAPARSLPLLALVLLLLCAAPPGCSFPLPSDDEGPRPQQQPQGEGPGRRPQRLALSPKQELAVGRRAYQQVLGELRGRLLPQDSPEVERARRVVEKLATAARIEPLQREINLNVRGYRFEWEVNVARDRQVNAFCLPAGKMVVFTGILALTQRDDAMLAAVLSHEMAHALAHHASERVAREQAGGESPLRSLYYDRAQEAEADHIGVFLMAFAGYDPRKAVTLWERMSQAAGVGKRQVPEILSSHPAHEHRIQALRKQSLDAMRARKAYDEGRVAPPRR